MCNQNLKTKFMLDLQTVISWTTSTMSLFPSIAAKWSGVCKALSQASTSAPLSKSHIAISVWPRRAATCNKLQHPHYEKTFTCRCVQCGADVTWCGLHWQSSETSGAANTKTSTVLSCYRWHGRALTQSKRSSIDDTKFNEIIMCLYHFHLLRCSTTDTALCVTRFFFDIFCGSFVSDEHNKTLSVNAFKHEVCKHPKWQRHN
jgi:hypothetical protein